MIFVIILFGIQQLNKLWKKTFLTFTNCHVSWNTLYNCLELCKLIIFDCGFSIKLKWLLNFYCRKTGKRQYLAHYCLDKYVNGNVVNQSLSSLHKGSLEIMLSVPLWCFSNLNAVSCFPFPFISSLTSNNPPATIIFK